MIAWAAHNLGGLSNHLQKQSWIFVEEPEQVPWQVSWAGVNICPKKSETVFPPIWGILKLAVLLNQKILKLSFKIFKQSMSMFGPKLSTTQVNISVYSLSGFWNCLAWKGQASSFLFTPVLELELFIHPCAWASVTGSQPHLKACGLERLPNICLQYLCDIKHIDICRNRRTKQSLQHGIVASAI